MSFLNIKEYNKIVKDTTPKEPRVRNIIISFLCGGMIGALGEWFSLFLQKMFNVSEGDSFMYLMIVLVFIASLLTGLGVFDKIASVFKAGVIVPSSVFAHAMSASAMDHHSEGLVKGIGSNIFKMTGSIILYGIISAVVFALIKVVIL